MQNVTVAQVIAYTRLQASAGYNMGARLTKPRYRKLSSLNKDSGFLDVWEAYLSEAAGHNKDAEVLLLKIENLDPLEEADFVALDAMIKNIKCRKAA